MHMEYVVYLWHLQQQQKQLNILQRIFDGML